MAELLIVYHSQSGASAALAHAAARGAQQESEACTMLRAVDAGARTVAGADGLLLVCAENSGRLAGGAKDFLDRIFYPLHQRGRVLPYGLLISAGNDGSGAVAEAERILRGIPFSQALEPRIVVGEPSPQHLEEAAELGAAFATGLELGIF